MKELNQNQNNINKNYCTHDIYNIKFAANQSCSSSIREIFIIYYDFGYSFYMRHRWSA
jgi:hypothetical protein